MSRYVTKKGYEYAGPNFLVDPTRDVYLYTYKCGHTLEVPGVAMARGGQVVPPLCPTCHGQAVIDKMEYANWAKEPTWAGYLSGQMKTSTGSNAESLRPTGNLTWLNLQLNGVTGKAWH